MFIKLNNYINIHIIIGATQNSFQEKQSTTSHNECDYVIA